MRRIYSKGASIRKFIVILSVTVIAVVAFLSACAPQTQPTPAPVATQTPPSKPSQSTLPSPTTQDTAWAKILESAQKEGKLTIYSYNFIGDVGIAMTRKFKDRYGISVDIITGRGSEFIERLKVEKRTGQTVADMTEGSSLHVNNMKREGLTEKISDFLPALREKDVWFVDPFVLDPTDKEVIVFDLLTYTPYVNSKSVKAGEEPKVWRDLLDPKWKGQMVLTDPMTSGGPEQLFVPLLREKIIDEDYLKSLGKQDLRYASASPDEGGILSRGERLISIRGVDIVYSRFVAEGAPIRAIAMTDGTVVSAVQTAAYKSAPHPSAAKVFINWFMSAEGQDTYSKAASMTSLRKDVKNYLPQAAQIEPKRLVFMTDDDNNKATDLFRQHWLAKILGRQ